MIGRTLGRFRIVAPLGQGGMATVWRAHDELLGRDLAVKILADALAQSEESRRRFRHEALIAAGLDHPGIAAVHDSGETGGLTWIAMALIEGETLAERIRRSLPPVAQVASVACAVADALGYAHERGVVHRDVTSRNVMLGNDGRVFVLDFGLALAQGASRISSSGTTVGTAPYMAPEVLMGGKASPGSDLYGLGVVMYEALTGSLPFPADRPAAAVFARLHQAPRPPRDLRPEIPGPLEAIVLRCLARDPAHRFAGAQALMGVLRELETGPASAPSGAAGSGPPPGPAPAGESRIAERIADGSGVLYLAIPPFEAAGDRGTDGALAETALGLERSAAAALSRLERLHVVRAAETPASTDSGELRRYARAIGANLLVLGTLRKSGSRLRVSYALFDPEAGLHLEGDTLEGSALDPFELEDRWLGSLRRALARRTGDPPQRTGARPRDPAADEHFVRALRYLTRHDHEASVDGAIGILERLVEADPGEAKLHATLARACLIKYELTRERNWETRCAVAAARAAELAPDAADTLLALADLHRVAGRPAEAEREYGLVLAQRPGDLEARLGRARLLHAAGRPDDAERDCRQALEAHPGEWRAHSMLGYLRFSRGLYEGSLEPWRRVVELVPDSALAARNLGSALFHLDRYDEAVAELERSLAMEPNAIAYTNLGTVLFHAGRFDACAEAFEKSVALQPGDPAKWGNLGNAYRFIPGRESRATEALERAIGLMRERLDRNPGEAEAWGRLAGWLVNAGRRAEAEAALAEALRRGPGDVHCMVNALHVHWQLGHRAEALHWAREAVRHGYGPHTLRRSPDLAGLRGDPEFEAALSHAPGKREGQEPGLDGREERT